MKRLVWSGRLPRYWVESPWWADVERDVLLLVPMGGRSVLCRRTTAGAVAWERPTTANILLACEEDVVVTARVRNGRSDAVLFQITAMHASTGHEVWSLPAETVVHLPKGGVLQVPVTRRGTALICLDAWRSMKDGRLDGSPPHVEPVVRGKWSHGTTELTENSIGLSVARGDQMWQAPHLTLRNILGIKGDHLIGVSPDESMWVRDIRSGSLVWKLDYDEGSVVVPSERVLGCDALVWSHADTVPIVGIVEKQGMLVLQLTPEGTALIRWPGQAIIEAWDRSSSVVLLGPACEGCLVLEELNDGTGCLWFVQ